MKIYGLSVDDQMLILKQLNSQLDALIRAVEVNPNSSLLMEAELAAASAQDHLRDMTLWLRGTREAVDRSEGLIAKVYHHTSPEPAKAVRSLSAA
jgi:hypothetical protein